MTKRLTNDLIKAEVLAADLASAAARLATTIAHLADVHELWATDIARSIYLDNAHRQIAELQGHLRVITEALPPPLMTSALPTRLQRKGPRK